MALIGEEASKERAAIQAQEQQIKERWCRLEGHKWDLPQPNPLNSDTYLCALRCNRCGITAKLTIVIDAAPLAEPPVAVKK